MTGSPHQVVRPRSRASLKPRGRTAASGACLKLEGDLQQAHLDQSDGTLEKRLRGTFFCCEGLSASVRGNAVLGLGTMATVRDKGAADGISFSTHAEEVCTSAGRKSHPTCGGGRAKQGGDEGRGGGDADRLSKGDPQPWT